MTPVELLKSTQQAAAEPEMLEWHEELKSLQKTQATYQRLHQTNSEQLDGLKTRQENNRVDVERMREKVETQKRVAWLEECRPIGLVTASRTEAQEAKETQRRLQRELNQLREDAAPALQSSNAKAAYLKTAEHHKKECANDIGVATQACSQLDKEDQEMQKQITESCDLITAETNSTRAKKQTLLHAQRDVTKLRQKSNEPPPDADVDELNERIKEIKARQRQIVDDKTALKESLATLRTRQEDKRSKGAALKKKKEELDTKAGQQLSKLEKAYPDTHRAWTWITENRGLFEREVFGPPMISCSLKDIALADKIESLLRPTDFKMITFQTQKDFETMRQQAKRMNIHDLSLRVRSSGSLEEYRPPLRNEQLHSLGFDSWALDDIEGPANVLAMLCERNLHAAAISRRPVDGQQYEDIVKSGLSCFVAGSTSYLIARRREYGSAGESTRTTEVRPARVWNHSAGDYSGEKASISREVAELRSDFEAGREQMIESEKELKHLMDETKSLDTELGKVQKEKTAKQDLQRSYDSLPALLRQAEEKEARAEEDVTGVKDRVAELQQRVDERLLQRADIALRYVTACEVLREAMEKNMQAELWRIEAQSDLETLNARHTDLDQQLKAKAVAETEAVQTAAAKAQEAKKYIAQVQALIKKAQNMQKNGNDSGLHDFIQDLIRAKVDAAEIEHRIVSDTARLELIQNINGNVIEEFEKRQATIAELEKSLATINKDLEKSQTEIAKIRQQWEPRLDELVGRISEKFGESFARIGCAGQVTVFKASSRAETNEEDENAPDDDALGHTGDGLNFEKWAIHISVKFRANEPLSLLNAQRQSGGERAVSTIFYLMALQSLSRAPFRVVDEINQGMDPRNERMVHGRMVDMCSPGDEISDDDNAEGKGSQYFLITPKLLSGLKYKRGMTVLCIASGEHMPAAVENDEDGAEVQTGAVDDTTGQPVMKKSWRLDLKHFVQRARSLNIKNGASGRKIDSEVGMSARQRQLASSFDGRRSDSYGDDEAESVRFTPSQTLSVGA